MRDVGVIDALARLRDLREKLRELPDEVAKREQAVACDRALPSGEKRHALTALRLELREAQQRLHDELSDVCADIEAGVRRNA